MFKKLSLVAALGAALALPSEAFAQHYGGGGGGHARRARAPPLSI